MISFPRRASLMDLAVTKEFHSHYSVRRVLCNTTCCVRYKEQQIMTSFLIVKWCKKAHNTRSVKRIWYKHSGTDILAASAVYSHVINKFITFRALYCVFDSTRIWCRVSFRAEWGSSLSFAFRQVPVPPSKNFRKMSVICVFHFLLKIMYVCRYVCRYVCMCV